MRIFTPLFAISAIAVTAVATPAMAQSQYREPVGNWVASGSGGDCLSTLKVGDAMLMVVAPASNGENSGGLLILNKNWQLESGSTTIRLDGKGSWAREWDAHADPELHGYWLAFDTARDADQFPDSWQLRAFEGRRLIADFAVSGFTAAVAKMRECVGKAKAG
jgi:hypothetical protein